MSSFFLVPVVLDPTSTSNDRQGACDTQMNGKGEMRGTVPFNDEVTQKFPPRWPAESLCSMWKVISRVKSLIVDGDRLENLVWRVWNQKLNFEKQQLLPQRLSSYKDGDGGGDEALSDLERHCSLATDIPDIKPIKFQNNGYSSILSEIQQASAELLQFPQNSQNFIMKSDKICTHSLPSASGSSDSYRSLTSVKTNSIQSSSRRKKKNVDKFMKKQQMNSNSLERITEQVEEIKSGEFLFHDQASGSFPGDKINKLSLEKGNSKHEINPQNSSMSKGVNSTCSEFCKQHAKRYDGEGHLFARVEPARKYSSSSASKANVSMLTMLLNRNNESRKVDSCQLSSAPMGASPPTRPSAPIPNILPQNIDGLTSTATGPALGFVDSQSLESSTSPSSQVIQPIRRTSVVSVHTPSPPQSSTSNRRSRPPPKPSDYTTPLYIW